MIKKNNFIEFGKPSIGINEIKEVVKVINSEWIGSGPITEKFEKKFKSYKETNFSVSLNSCTAALHLSLIVLGIKPGDEVITTPLTFCSTINSILLVGAKPILVDIDPETLNIDENKIIDKITKKTKAIILVHFAGLPCNLKKILKISKTRNIKIIEDCAHAIESKYYGKHVGTFGDTGCFSFYATKNITTGEGGMVISNNAKAISRIKTMRLHGMTKDAWKRHLPDNIAPTEKFQHYDVTEVGLKYNMIDLNASIGIVQLKQIEKNWRKRRKIHDFYLDELKNLPLIFQKIDRYPVKHAHHLFTIRIDKSRTKKTRDNLIKFLKKNKIGAGVNYRSVTDMTYYRKNLGWNSKICKNAKLAGDTILSIPSHPSLKKNEIKYICNKVKEYFK